MGFNVRAEHLTVAELEQLATMKATSTEGVRLRDRVAELWAERAHPIESPQRGRWLPLTWFCEKERILTPDELRSALARHTVDGVATLDALTKAG